MSLSVLNTPQAISEWIIRLGNIKTLAVTFDGLDLMMAYRDEIALCPGATSSSSELKRIIEDESIYKICLFGKSTYIQFKAQHKITMENIMCLEMAQRLLKAGLWTPDDFTFQTLAKEYLNRDITPPQEGWPTELHHAHMGGVIKMIYELGKVMWDKLELQNMLRVYRLECDAVPAFGDMEFYGQRIDRIAWEMLIEANQRDSNIAKAQMDRFLAPVLDCDDDGNPIINYNSAQQVLNALKMMGLKVDGKLIDSTNKDTLRKLMHIPFIQSLRTYRSAETQLSNFGQKYLDYANEDGRIFPKYHQIGTSTGRPACYGGVNFLNIPKEASFRSAFIAGPDRLLSSVDYSGSDLRAIADRSNDPNFVKVFNERKDVHSYASSILYGKQITKDDPLRAPGKALNFGMAFGKTDETLYEELSLVMPITLEEVKKLSAMFKNHFRTATNYLNSRAREVGEKYVLTNMNGRKRRWVKPENWNRREAPPNYQREAMNFDPQSTSAEFAKVALARMRKHFKAMNYDAYIYGFVYDEIIVSTHVSCAKEVHEAQKAIMIEAAEEMFKHIPMEVEGYLSPRWSEVKL